jgi:hypothetical protein
MLYQQQKGNQVDAANPRSEIPETGAKAARLQAEKADGREVI